jgi:hypothetical protein
MKAILLVLMLLSALHGTAMAQRRSRRFCRRHPNAPHCNEPRPNPSTLTSAALADCFPEEEEVNLQEYSVEECCIEDLTLEVNDQLREICEAAREVQKGTPGNVKTHEQKEKQHNRKTSERERKTSARKGKTSAKAKASNGQSASASPHAKTSSS